MPTLELGYGPDAIKFDYDGARFEVLAPDESEAHPLTDAEIGAAFDAPVQSPIIEEIFAPGDTILIVVSDATRATASAQILNLLVRRLIQLGIPSHDLGIIFATGIHRAVTDEDADWVARVWRRAGAGSRRIDRRFSRILSKMTIVSLVEKPVIVKMAAMTFRLMS